MVYKNWNKRFLAVTGVVLNLSIIAFFKYSGMLSRTFGVENTEIGAFLVSLPLPLGISFFTFEGISLVVDTYKGRDIGEYKSIIVSSLYRHLGNTVLFVSFFPHLIAGPILKAREFYPQIGPKGFLSIQWDTAFKQLVLGYFLKMVIADNLKDQTFWIAYPYFLHISSETLAMMLFGYSIQIFADFAGYSLIALGLATLFGYELKGNFDHPYISTSFSEFWRRWHMSLSSFLREYLYIPLGGNRKGKGRTYLNLFITMFLGGLWHGAAWSYAIWGMTHGVFLALERLVNDHFTIRVGKGLRILKWVMVFSLVTIAWLLFKLPNISHAVAYLTCMATNMDLDADIKRNCLIFVYAIPIFLYSLQEIYKETYLIAKLKKAEWMAYGAMIFLLITNSGSSTDFIYFQF
jgi:alginate O-acetyltransferase complex protein AlgI